MVPNKSLVVNFPTCVPENLIRHFIRGYYDGNGSIYMNIKSEKNHHVTLTITSTDSFCKTISEIVSKELNIKHNELEDADMYLKRKYDRYCEYYNN